jgi:hypothetical protein
MFLSYNVLLVLLMKIIINTIKKTQMLLDVCKGGGQETQRKLSIDGVP